MTAFWIVIAALLVLVSLALVLPLWRGEGKQSISRSALNKQLYRQRLLEIGEEREQGILAEESESLVELQRSLLDDIPAALPGLTRAVKLSKRAASVGFDWDDVYGPIAKVREELLEVEAELDSGDQQALEEELGDLLFAVVNIARYQKIDPEQALRRANHKFEQRFHYIEKNVPQPLSETSIDEMNMLWDEAKRI